MSFQILIDWPVLALHMTSYLSGRDTFRLQCVSQSLHEFVTTNDDPLFRTALVQDFPEGQLLAEAFNSRGGSSVYAVPSYKKMYLAFHNRFKLKKERVGKHVAISWRHPPRGSFSVMNEAASQEHNNQDTENISKNEDDVHNDVKALVFIFRVWDCPNSCGFLTWYKDEVYDMGDDLLKMDEVWYEDSDYCLELPPLKNGICRTIGNDSDNGGIADYDMFSDILHQVETTYRLSVHAIDLQTCQVLTLLEDAPGHNVDELNTSELLISDHTDDTADLYGLPYRGSPFYRNISQDDYDSMNFREVECLFWTSSLYLHRAGHCFDGTGINDDDDSVYTENIEFNLIDELSSITNRYSISNFLRALMREKCLDLRSVVDEDVPQDMSFVLRDGEMSFSQASVEHPEWVQSDKILDAILSFVPFEDQVATLRLVCKHFKTSALRQLEGKLLDTGVPIVFTKYEICGWFRVDARRGWSDGFTSRGEVIDSALRMLSCRCNESCEGGDSCPGTQAAPSYRAGGKTKFLDVAQARRLLIENGHCNLTRNFPGGQNQRRARRSNSVGITFQREEGKSLFQLCQDVYDAIDEGLDYDGMMPDNLRRYYGISGEMTVQGFLRSLFLTFTDGASITEGHFPEITTAMAEAHLTAGEGGHYGRMTKIFRFTTATHKPVEIVLETHM